MSITTLERLARPKNPNDQISVIWPIFVHYGLQDIIPIIAKYLSNIYFEDFVNQVPYGIFKYLFGASIRFSISCPSYCRHRNRSNHQRLCIKTMRSRLDRPLEILECYHNMYIAGKLLGKKHRYHCVHICNMLMKKRRINISGIIHQVYIQ